MLVQCGWVIRLKSQGACARRYTLSSRFAQQYLFEGAPTLIAQAEFEQALPAQRGGHGLLWVFGKMFGSIRRRIPEVCLTWVALADFCADGSDALSRSDPLSLLRK